jgi:hypothetical protein
MKIKLDIYETINIYNENGIIFSTVRGAFERATIDGKKCSTYYGNRVFYIDLPIDNIRNALKLNFNKNDVFTLKEYANDRYEIRNGRALYIPEKYISVGNLGEYLALETNGEKDFLTLYRLAFATVQTVSEPKIERIICDNYTLQDGETFGSYYGKDKAHAVISTFDTSESAYHQKKGIPAEKGILKHYFEDVTYNEFIVKSDYYTRTEKDEARTEREKIAEIINSCLYNKTLSHYDIGKIMEKLNITVKED